jgi:hypothetical protein
LGLSGGALALFSGFFFRPAHCVRPKEKAGRKSALREWGGWGDAPRILLLFCSGNRHAENLGSPSMRIGWAWPATRSNNGANFLLFFQEIVNIGRRFRGVANALRDTRCFKFENNVLKSLTELRG